MSAWIRSLGLAVTGGQKGTINAVREQVMRIARCSFTLQWEDRDAQGNTTVSVRDQRIVEGLSLWNAASDASKWSATVELGQQFYEHLREHSVPLDKRTIAHLSNNSLGLDLYTLFANRLPHLRQGLHLSWRQLLDQLVGDQGSEYANGAKLAAEAINRDGGISANGANRNGGR